VPPVSATAATAPAIAPGAAHAAVAPVATVPAAAVPESPSGPRPAPGDPAPGDPAPGGPAPGGPAPAPGGQPFVPREFSGPRPPTCTVAQLRRFIKSRPWIPLHELRRRFGIEGGDDDVSPIRVGDHTLFIGLPSAEGRMMAELLSGGEVGYELSLDPGAPIVVGVYPMRPVPRG
jgi:hypothetical protein